MVCKKVVKFGNRITVPNDIINELKRRGINIEQWEWELTDSGLFGYDPNNSHQNNNPEKKYSLEDIFEAFAFHRNKISFKVAIGKHEKLVKAIQLAEKVGSNGIIKELVKSD